MNRLASNRQKTAIAFKTLPPEMATALRLIIRRVRTIIILRGLLATLAVALLAIMTVMAIDATTVILNQTIRTLLSSAIFVTTLITAVRRLVMPLARPFTPVRMAHLIERRRPELEERLSTVVEILSGGTQIFGSERLFSKLMETACGDIRQFRPEQEFTMRTVKPRLIAANAAFAVLVILLIAFPRPAGRLFLRAIAPHAQVGNFYAGLLKIEPGDSYVLRNQPIEIIATTSPQLQSHPVIRRSSIGKTHDESVERMHVSDTLPDGSRVYRHLVPAVTEPFAYRVVAGFAVSRHYNIQSLEVPNLEQLELTITQPPYTERKALTITNQFHNRSALVGSRLEWKARYNRTPMNGRLRFGAAFLEMQPIPDGAAWATTLTPGPARTWFITLKDTYGHTNTPAPYTFAVQQDTPPQVRIARPEARRIELPPYAVLPVTGICVDDFGIGKLELEWAFDDHPYAYGQAVDTLQPTGDTQTWRADTILQLGRLLLDNVRQVRVRLYVEDNLPAYLGGAQSAVSEEIIVILNHQAQSAAAQAAEKQYKDIQKILDETARELETARKEVKATAETVKTDPEAAREALDATQEKLTKTEEAVRDAAEETKGSLHDPIADALEKLAADELEAAKQQTESAQLAETESLPEAITALQKKLDEAIEAVRKLSEESKTFSEELKKLIDLDALTRREEALTEKTQRAEDAKMLDALRKEQEDIRRKMKGASPHNPETFKQMLENQQSKLKEAQAESKNLAERQEALNSHLEALKDPLLRDSVTKKLEDLANVQKTENEIAKETAKDTADTTPVARADALQKALAEEARELAKKTQELKESLRDWGQLASKPTQLADQGARKAEEAARQAEEAAQKNAEPPKAEPDVDAAREATEQANADAKTAQEQAETAQHEAGVAKIQAGEAEEAARQAIETAKAAGDALQETLKAIEKQVEADAQAEAQVLSEAVEAAQTRADEAQSHAEEAKAEARTADEHAATAQEAAKSAAEAAEKTKAQAALAEHKLEKAEAEQEAIAERQLAEAEAAQAAKTEDAKDDVKPTRKDTSHEQKQASEAFEKAAEAFEQAAEAMQPMIEKLNAVIAEKQARVAEKNALKTDDTTAETAADTADTEATDDVSSTAPESALTEAEEAMFEADSEWEKLKDIEHLEATAASIAEAQAEALLKQQDAEKAGAHPHIQQAQQQAEHLQRKATETLDAFSKQRDTFELPEPAVEAWEAAREAQKTATKKQQEAAAEQRDASRAEQHADQAKKQADTLKQHAQNNNALSDQAREAEEKAKTLQTTAQEQAETARQTQEQATAEQRRAAQVRANADLATRAERKKLQQKHQEQAKEAIQAASKAMRSETLERAEKIGIKPETLAEQLAAVQPELADSPSDDQEDDEQSSASGSQPSNMRDKRPEAETPPLDVEVDPMTSEGRRSLFPAWFRLGGSPRAGADEERWQDVPAEYRPLVQDYFRKLSEEQHNE